MPSFFAGQIQPQSPSLFPFPFPRHRLGIGAASVRWYYSAQLALPHPRVIKCQACGLFDRSRTTYRAHAAYGVIDRKQTRAPVALHEPQPPRQLSCPTIPPLPYTAKSDL